MNQAINRLKNCTVRLSHDGGKSHDGTGFFVAPNLIITCAHVCHKFGSYQAYAWWNNTNYPVKIIKCSDDVEQYDLALLELEDKEIKHPYLLLEEKVNIGDNLYSYGYPGNQSNGDVGTYEVIGFDGNQLLKFKQGLVKEGQSGSPLFNLNTNKVCGLIVISLDTKQDIGGRGIPVSVIYDYFPELKQLKTVKENPFIPVREPIKNYQKLFGREGIIEKIFDILNSGGSVALVGKTKTGKTSILKAVQQLARDNLNKQRKVIYLDLGHIFEDHDFYFALCDEIGISIKNNQPPTGYFFFREMKKHRVLLLLDGIAQMTWEGFTEPLRRQIRSLANSVDPPLRLVIAANKSLTQLFADSGQNSPFEGICQELRLTPWNETIIREFIKLRLSQTNIQFSEEEIKSIINESQGNPQKVMQLCYECYQLKC
ncbi:MAG: trypsin-like peptidase domain-containing protein [Crocosphaera sp.]|nr:trypsin-like peptidase domain-containing protein [Crocosphaera sp.]